MNPSRILVVEDDGALAQALTDTLQLSGYEVVNATDGEQALAKLDHDQVDMVLTDVQMRPMDGRALLRSLRTRFQELPVLVMTAYGTVEQAVEAMKLGAVDYLAKPFEVDDLLAKVERYLPYRHHESGQMVADHLTAARIDGILNFAPVKLQAPDDVFVRNVNLAIAMESLSYSL
ncbi:MAG: response regulator, partial [Deltaproteobacteria bacterium]|nr:response regulator [Deltaproteobacteria bacterium]